MKGCERTSPHKDSSRFLLDLQVVPATKEITHLLIAVDPSHTFLASVGCANDSCKVACGADSIMLEVPDPENSAVDPSNL